MEIGLFENRQTDSRVRIYFLKSVEKTIGDRKMLYKTFVLIGMDFPVIKFKMMSGKQLSYLTAG